MADEWTYNTGNDYIADTTAMWGPPLAETEDQFLVNVMWPLITKDPPNPPNVLDELQSNGSPGRYQIQAANAGVEPEILLDFVKRAFWFQGLTFPLAGAEEDPQDHQIGPAYRDHDPMVTDPATVDPVDLDGLDPGGIDPALTNIAIFGPGLTVGLQERETTFLEDPSGFTLHGSDPNVVITGSAIPTPTIENVEAGWRPANSVNTDVVPVDWTRRTEDEPFFAENSSEYSITVLACEGFVPGVENEEISCEAAMQQATAQGILNLAEFYNRKLPEGRGAQLALLQSAETEYHLDERPKARAKILVKIPSRIFDLLPEITEDPSIDPDTGMPRNASITLDSLTIKEQIDKVTVGLLEHAEQARIQGLNITGLNISNESKRLGSFLAKLKDLLVKNRYSLNQEVQVSSDTPAKEKEGNKIKIGFTQKYEIKHVLFNSKPASIGFSAFRKAYPMSNPTTVAYVSRLDEMVEDLSLNNPPSLTEFILKYTYPRPQISAGAPGQTFSLPGVDINIKGLPEIPDIPDVSKLPKAPKIPKISNLGDAVSLASSLADAAKTVRQTVNDVYTSASNRRKEDKKIKDPDFVAKAASDASLEAHFVGDNVLGNLPNIIDRVGGDIEAVFSEILNKIDITTIAQFAAAAALGEFPNLGNLMKGAVSMFFDKVNNSNKKYFNSAFESPDLIDFTWDLSFLDMGPEPLSILESTIPERSRPIVMAVFDNIVRYDNTPGRLIVEYFRDIIASYIASSREKVDTLVQEICVAAELNSTFTTTPMVEELGILIATNVAYLKILQLLVPNVPKSTPEGDFATALAATIATLKIAEQICDPKKFDMFDIPSLPSFPSIELPRLPTFDIMGWVIPQLEIAFPDFIFNIIISIVLETITAALDIDLDFDPSSICSCVDPVLNLNIEGSMSFGEMDVGSMIMDGLTTVGTAIGTSTGLIEEEEIDPTSDMFGWILSQYLEFPPGTDRVIVGRLMKIFLEDVSSQLTPDESLSLLRGTATMRTVRVAVMTMNAVPPIAVTDYSVLKGFFGNPINTAKVIDVFEHIGRFLDSETAESTRDQAVSDSENMSVSDRREQLLADKYGDSLSSEQIKSESDKNAERNNLQAVKLLQATPDSPALDMSPPPVVGGSSAMIPKNPPSVQHMMDRTIETMFESIIMTFEQAVHGPRGFIQTMCFKSGTRSIYEMLKQQDDLREIMLQSGWNDWSPLEIRSVFTPPDPLAVPPALGGFSPTPGHAMHLAEVNNSIMGVIKTYLENIEFEKPAWIPWNHRRLRDIDFKLPTPNSGDNDINWEFITTMMPNLSDDPKMDSLVRLQEHVLKIPAPPRFPFKLNHDFQIRSAQKVESELESGDAARILNQVTDFTDPRLLFSELTTQGLNDQFPDFDREPIENYLKGTAYYNTMTDIIKMFADELLKSERVLNAEVATIMDWRLEPQSDQDGETQTTLLGLEELREKTKEKYDESSKEEDTNASDDIQKALLSSVVEATIRLLVVEIFLKTLPVFDIFKKDDVLSDDFIEYVILRVQEACVRQDPYWPGYYENILEHTEKAYEEEWESNNKNLKDPITKLSLPSPKKIGAKGALNYFIKNTLLKMSNTLGELPMIRSGERAPIAKIFLNSMMSFKNKGHGIFNVPQIDNRSKLPSIEGVRSDESDVLREFFNEQGYHKLYKDRFLENIGSKDEGTLVSGEQSLAVRKLRSGLDTFQDGGLLLEKYIQYTVSEEQDKYPGPVIGTKIRSLQDGIDEDDLWRSWVSDLKIGLRLVYMPEFDLQDVDLLKHIDEFKEHRSDLDGWRERRQVVEDTLAFHVLERFVGQKFFGTEHGWKSQAIYRDTHPLPLIGVTKPIERDDEEVYITGEEAQQYIEGVNFGNYKEDLIEEMMKQDRFKVLFEHCFPLQKILSIITIYIEVIFSTAGDARLLSVFDQTRSTLKSIFDSILNMNDFSYRDRNIESAGGNAGLHRGRPRRVFTDGRLSVVYNNDTSSFEKRG